MFGNKEKKLVVHSVVDKNCAVVGDFVFNGGMQICGTVTGNLVGDDEAETILIIEQTAAIRGRVEADHLIIDGVVNGPVLGRKSVVIKTHGQVNGNVTYWRIQMEDGARVDGQLLPVGLIEAKKPQQSPESAPMSAA